MPYFSLKSKRELSTVSFDLQAIFQAIIPWYDLTILEGRRSQERQDELFALGFTQLKWPNGNHNVRSPSALAFAVDAAPWIPGIGVPYPDALIRAGYSKAQAEVGCIAAFSYLAGIVKATAQAQGKKIRWGGDWDGDDILLIDQRFDDLGHFELLQ